MINSESPQVLIPKQTRQAGSPRVHWQVTSLAVIPYQKWKRDPSASPQCFAKPTLPSDIRGTWPPRGHRFASPPRWRAWNGGRIVRDITGHPHPTIWHRGYNDEVGNYLQRRRTWTLTPFSFSWRLDILCTTREGESTTEPMVPCFDFPDQYPQRKMGWTKLFETHWIPASEPFACRANETGAERGRREKEREIQISKHARLTTRRSWFVLVRSYGCSDNRFHVVIFGLFFCPRIVIIGFFL